MTTILAILIAAIIGTVVGFLWYHPRAFGTTWMQLSGIKPEQTSGGNRMLWVTLGGFLVMLVMAAILYLQTFAEADLARAMLHAFWLWLGFMAPVLLGSVLWERKSFKLFAINGAYWLIAVLGMTIALQVIA